jgi:hypothetical protein
MTEPEPFLALVKWTDAHHMLDYDEGLESFDVETVGWVLSSPPFIVVAQERMPPEADNAWRGVTFIPVKVVDEIIRLAELEDLEGFQAES